MDRAVSVQVSFYGGASCAAFAHPELTLSVQIHLVWLSSDMTRDVVCSQQFLTGFQEKFSVVLVVGSCERSRVPANPHVGPGVQEASCIEICVDEPAGLGPEADDSEKRKRHQSRAHWLHRVAADVGAQSIQEAVTSHRSGEESFPDRLKELEW
jgi:hypothetical protein